MCYNFTVIEPKCDKVNVCYYLVVTKNVDDTLMRYNSLKSNEVFVKSFSLIIFLSINEESVVVNIFILIVPFIKVAGESDTCGWIWKRRFKCSNRGKVIEWLRSDTKYKSL